MKKIILTLAISAFAATASAFTPLWIRNARISPDGSQIAFTYKGSIYKVAANGGQATRLTSGNSYDTAPIWSPDGKSIAFSSDRAGSPHLFVMPAQGGQPRQLTFNSTNSTGETPLAFSPDGKSVIFSAIIQDTPESVIFPTARMSEVYTIPVDGGAYTQLMGLPALSLDWSPDGSYFVYEDRKGMENTWRKHHTSSVTRDIWTYTPSTGHHTQLTVQPGDDTNPVLSADGKTVYFLSEREGGSVNVWSQPVDKSSAATKITEFTTHPVRHLSISSAGKMAFTYDGELYTMTTGSSPHKVEVDIIDFTEEMPERTRVSSTREHAVSPDGKMVAFTARGELYVTSVEYPTTRQISSTPAAERYPSWNPDNRGLVYVSERDGIPALYKASITRDDDPDFPNATIINETPLISPTDGIERTLPEYSPDGSKIAFIQDRCKLMVMDTASGKITQITDGSTEPSRTGGFNYTWSPDSKWIAFEHSGNGHIPYSDIAIVNVEGTPEITYLTRTSYFDDTPKWVLDGNAIAFRSDRYGMRSQASWGSTADVMLVFMNRDALDRYRLSKEDYALRKQLDEQHKKKSDTSDSKKKTKDDKESESDNKKVSDIDIELDGILDRVVRVTPYSSDLDDFAVSPDGEKIYYLSAVEDGYDLWAMDLRKREPSIVKKLNIPGATMQFDKKGASMYILSSGKMQKMGLKGEKFEPITYSATYLIDPAAEREAMFSYMKREEGNRFYRTDMHGVDWEAMTAHYAKFLPHINNNADFAEMLSELLGELNVSHTGGRFYPSYSGDRTASLGLLFDLGYQGEGLKVAEVIQDGPFDHAGSDVKAGSVIIAINGTPVRHLADADKALAALAGKKTLVSLSDGTEEVVVPVNPSKINSLLYQRWVRRRAADVDSLSGGRLGYIHIQSMDNESYQTIYADLLGKYIDKEGIVIDIRWNGGGRLHEDIEVLFSGKKYFSQVIRGQEAGSMPSRRWNKPSVMLVNEACYSNAHGTPWVYKHLNLGKVVGTPVPGTMTSVNWVRMQDPTLVFGIPVTGYLTAEGTYLENSQLEPDILVTLDPESAVAGVDTQLRKAVQVLLDEIDSKK